MKDTILEFTLNGRKHTYFRRIDVFNEPLVTNNINNAKKVNESSIPKILKSLVLKYGKDNIKDFKPIKKDKKKNGEN